MTNSDGLSAKPSIASLTGLRGIAALFVVITHYSIWCSAYDPATTPGYIGWLFNTADDGMTLFFTLSGFVITYNYYDFGWERTPVGSLLRFVYYRISRLYPALLVFLFGIVMLHSMFAILTPDYLHWLLLHLLFAQSWFPLKYDGALVGNAEFHVSWSISTEFMLYLMFAVVVLAIRQCMHRGWRAGAVAVGALAGMYISACVAAALSPTLFGQLVEMVGRRPDFTAEDWYRWFFFLSPYFRIVDFFLGSIAAIAILRYQAALAANKRWLRPLAALSVLAAAALFIGDNRYRIFAPLGEAGAPVVQLVSATLFAILMVNGADDSRINHVLASKPFVTLGEISYSLYLFHYLLPRFGVYRSGLVYSGPLLVRTLINAGATLSYSLIFAYGMHALVEVPAQRALRRLIAPRRSVAGPPSSRVAVDGGGGTSAATASDARLPERWTLVTLLGVLAAATGIAVIVHLLAPVPFSIGPRATPPPAEASAPSHPAGVALPLAEGEAEGAAVAAVPALETPAHNPAYALRETQGDRFHRINILGVATIPDKLNVISVYVRPGARVLLRIELLGSSQSHYGRADFNFQTGEIKSADEAAVATITALEGNWFLVSFGMRMADAKGAVSVGLLAPGDRVRYSGEPGKGLILGAPYLQAR